MTVLVLALRCSPVPSIQTYMHCEMSSGCFRARYLRKRRFNEERGTYAALQVGNTKTEL